MASSFSCWGNTFVTLDLSSHWLPGWRWPLLPGLELYLPPNPPDQQPSAGGWGGEGDVWGALLPSSSSGTNEQEKRFLHLYSLHTVSHDFWQAVPHNLDENHNWLAYGSQLIEQLQVKLNDFFFVSKLCPPAHPLLTPFPHLDLQFETYKDCIIHHHTMTPKEQRKYHSSIYSGIKVVLENVTSSSQYSVPKKVS